MASVMFLARSIEQVRHLRARSEMRREPVTHLHERAEALGVGGVRTRRVRDELAWGHRIAAAMAALSGAFGPHRPIASADAQFEIVGQQIGQNKFGLHAAAGAALGIECDPGTLPMTVEATVFAR